MIRPRITLLFVITTRPCAEPACEPFSSTIGVVPVKPVCVVPSMVIGLVIVGSAVIGTIDRTPVPGMANVMVSGPACAFASRIA